MRSALFDAVARCQLRRLRLVVAGAPVPSAAVLAALLAAPLVLLHVGRTIGGEIGSADVSPRVAAALVVGPVLAALAGGAALALARPGRSMLGAQVAAAPLDPRAAVVAPAMVPLVALGAAALPALACTTIGLSSALPGGAASGCALSAAVIAAVVAGASAAEAAVGARRRSARAVGCLLLGPLGWVAAGAALGAPVLGPLAPTAAALIGEARPSVATTLSLGTIALLGLVWLELAVRRPETRPRGAMRTVAVVRRRRGAVSLAIAALLARRGDVRGATAGALLFGAVGVVLGASTSTPGEGTFLLATTTALVAALLCPLAACGAVLDGVWLWGRTPRKRAALAVAATAGGVTGAAVPTAAVAAVALAVRGVAAGTVATVAALVLISSCSALAAGALVPWRRDGVGDQASAFAALVGLGVGISVIVGFIAPRLVAAGAPSPVVAASVCGFVGAAAVGGVALRLGWRRP